MSTTYATGEPVVGIPSPTDLRCTADAADLAATALRYLAHEHEHDRADEWLVDQTRPLVRRAAIALLIALYPDAADDEIVDALASLEA
jgi:hypothetical protein